MKNILTSEAQNIGDFTSLKLAVYEADADLSTAQAVATSNSLTDFEAAKSLATAPITSYTLDEARDKVASAFGVTEPQETFFHYNPIAANDVQVQALAVQLGNLFVTAPLLVNNLSNGSVDVITKLVDSIVSDGVNDPVINLGSQTALENIFGVDNTPPNEGDPAPDLLKSLAEANVLVQNATTIDGQSGRTICCSG